jgi:ethylbenzene dioxygenase alpha subunit
MVGSMSSVTVFPNFSFLPGQNTFRVWQPRGPQLIELHTWILVNRNAPAEIKEAYRKGAMLTFSPTGVFEMDDGENWEYATRANDGVVTRRQRLYYGLGNGSETSHPELPGQLFQGQVNDANQRAFLDRWAQLMAAPSWNDVTR